MLYASPTAENPVVRYADVAELVDALVSGLSKLPFH
jgi:hypothetical protein